ncbi:hypothetical protein GF373_10515 [bacterium]|nr:hypothetical protein [bacterium]
MTETTTPEIQESSKPANAWTTERIVALILLAMLCSILVWKAYHPEDIYLVDIQYEFLQGSIEFEPKIDENRHSDAIQIDNTFYPRGLSVKANNDLRCRFIPQGYRFFVTEIGMDATLGKDSPASAVFRIMADGTLLYESPVMTPNMAPRFVRVSVKGRHELRLQVHDAGDGDAEDYAHWAMCRFEYR